MSSFGLAEIKNALGRALKDLPDWKEFSPFRKGQIIDQTFKKMLKDLMEQFDMEAGVDYEDNLRENEPSTDFVALSERADDLLQGLLSGKVVAVSAHVRTSKLGNQYNVEAHYRDYRKSA